MTKLVANLPAGQDPNLEHRVQSADETRALQALRMAHDRFSPEEIAHELNTNVRQMRQWLRDDQMPRARLHWRALNDLLREQPPRVVPTPPADFTFIDLFAGIGGTRLGFERVGGRCVFTSEYDRFCVETYRANFRPDHEIVGDIKQVDAASIPDHDVLVAGFPCQPFSIAGVSKKNALGRAHGFACDTQGTLFFDICRIIEAKKPAAFLLENVRNLTSHDKGRTFQVIMNALHELGYEVDKRIIDARAWVPQHRERIFIAGFRKPTAFTMDLVKVPDAGPALEAILHPEDGSEQPEGEYTVGAMAAVNDKYTLTKHLWSYLQAYKKKHEAAGNGFGFGLVTRNDVARTLSARYYKDGSEILVSRGSRRNPRRLTPRECGRLMGFPPKFEIPVSDTQAYKQFGNSVVVPVIEAVATAMKPHIMSVKAELLGVQVGMPV
jgi:DNA (cytosine-5)-methyltransferase 1